MMMNLFSVFDPSTSMSDQLNWYTILIIFFVMPTSYWIIYSRSEFFLYKILSWIYMEFKIFKKNTSNLIIITTLMMMIMILNFMGLFPYIFTITAHLTFTLTFALPIWMMIMLYGWINHTNHMFAHLLPLSTPPILMSFMILIESISNIIRPLTLAVRLMANMIAGHLLLTLIGSTGPKVNLMILSIILIIQMMLFTLEMAVTMIQSYVFSILSTLYMNEV